MNRVSIVITNYNYADYLAACIDSALAQDHGCVEVVVVDDGSTDGSAEVIERYRDDLIAVFRPNGGQAAAFNTGFAHTTGEIVIFLDADDLLDPAASSEAIRLFREAGVVKAHWPLRVIDRSGRSTGRLVPGPGDRLPHGDRRADVRTRGPATMRFPPTTGNAWSRDFLELVLPMEEDVFRIGADTLLFEVAPFVGSMARSIRPLGCYREHGANRWRRLSFAAHLDHELRFYNECARVAAELSTRHGSVDTTSWRQHSWWHRLDRAVRVIERTVPDGSPFALIDDNAWGLSTLGARRAMPFPVAANGQWAGVPGSDAEAVEALDRFVEERVAHLVVAWDSAWWLEAFPTLARRLGVSTVETSDVTICELG